MESKEISARFDEKIKATPKANNSVLLDEEKYSEIVNKLQALAKREKAAKQPGAVKTPKTDEEYRLERRYNLQSFVINGARVASLVKAGTNQRFVAKEDLFDSINAVHIDKGHAGIRITHAAIKEK